VTDKATLLTRALQLRKEFGEDSNSPIDIFSLVQNIEKLSLVFFPMGENLSGMSIKGQRGTCVIAINSAMSLGRQRFSLAHELYHLYYDKNMLAICSKKIGDGKIIEKEADVFASYLLIPAAELDNRAAQLSKNNISGKLSLDDVIRLGQYFGVSHKAMVIRLKENPYMDSDKTEEYLATGVRYRAEMLGFDSDLYKPLSKEKQYKTYGYYIHQADQLLKENLISIGKYEELLLTAFRSDLVYGEEGDGAIID